MNLQFLVFAESKKKTTQKRGEKTELQKYQVFGFKKMHVKNASIELLFQFVQEKHISLISPKWTPQNDLK